MTGFLVFAALLVLIAIAFAIVALWRGAPRLAIGLAVALPLAAGGLYTVVGAPKALDPANRAPPATIEDAVARLQAELKDAPENFENLVVMARSQMAIGKFPEAAASYEKALELQPGEAELGVEYAEARLRSAADRRFPPEVVPLLEAAVAKNPQNQRALFFLGLHRMQSGCRCWRRMRRPRCARRSRPRAKPRACRHSQRRKPRRRMRRPPRASTSRSDSRRSWPRRSRRAPRCSCSPAPPVAPDRRWPPGAWRPARSR
jgi:tetratricopeptide (TPR) repeat protein